MWPFTRREKILMPAKSSAFTTDIYSALERSGGFKGLELPQPSIPGVAMDSIDGSVPSFKGADHYGVPEAQAMWYASQGFIGSNMCAVIAKHWLVDKACNMPARDAIRQGYDIDCDKKLKDFLTGRKAKVRVDAAMRELIHFGRVFGGRLALFVVETSNPQEWYENPFNLDGVPPGGYKGIKQIDPQWVTPDLTAANLQDPAGLDFYEPTYYIIGNRRYHKSHFVKFVPYPVANVLKPTYGYFGVSVPERIYERVYASERTANEAPQLAMTKRLLTIGIDNPESADKDVIRENIRLMAEYRDNYGVQIGGASDVIQQFDTALADLDVTIMTQYQLVAAGASVPATKLLGTTPKGFNATGEYEESTYREELESIQTNDLDALLQRDLELRLRSAGIAADEFTVYWNPLDSPTAAEVADIELKKSQTAVAYQSTGAVDADDIREVISKDKDSSFFGLDMERELNADGEENPDEEQEGGVGLFTTGSDEGEAAGLFGGTSGALPEEP